MTGQPSVLLVEDDAPLSTILAAHLRATGLAVEIAPDAEAAMASLEAGARPDVIVLDINLPGDTGWSVLRSPAYERSGRPPVVLASAMAVSPDRLREFGIAGYLPKPFALETLRSTIERLAHKESQPG